MDETTIKEYLIKNDDRFRKLVNRHQKYEQQLETFVAKPFLTSEEQLEETVLKKKKLALKDQMQMLISRYQAEHPA